MFHSICIPRALRHIKLIGLLWGLLLTVCATARAQETFEPSTLDRFDGKTWHGLTLDRSTTDDIKRQYRTSKGAFRPEAMLLSQPTASGVNVQALFDGRGGNSRLVGFRLAYNEDGPDLNQLAQGMGSVPRTLYPRRRFSDWYVKAFPKTGVLAFVVREHRAERVTLVLLTTPDRADQLVSDFTGRATPIGDLKKSFDPDDVRVKFSNIVVNVSQQGLRIDDEGDLKDDIRNDMMAMPGSPNLQYGADPKGLCNVAITLKKPKNKEGNVSVMVTMSGNGPYGTVSASGYATQTFSRGLFGSVNVSRSVIRDTFREAQRRMGTSFTAQIRRGMPSNPKSYREQVWNALANEAIR